MAHPIHSRALALFMSLVLVAAPGALISQAETKTAPAPESKTFKSDTPIVIQADKAIALQHVVDVMDVAKKLQVTKLGISVQPPKK